MEPQIQYAKTRDGVSIAFWTMGDGEPPLIMGPQIGWSHISLELRVPELARWYEHLASRRMVVRYDPRCQGLSDREVEQIGEAELTSDVEAVIERLGRPQVDLLGTYGLGPPMVRVAAEHPHEVRKLVLCNAFINGPAQYADERTLTIRKLIETDWDLFTRAFAHQKSGWSPQRAQVAEAWSAYIRRAVSPRDAALILDALAATDWRPWLAKIRAPTLVLRHPRIAPGSDVRWADIEDVRLVDLQHQDDVFANDAGQVAIDEFLDEGESAQVSSSNLVASEATPPSQPRTGASPAGSHEPRIQYARRPDGARTAFAVMGSGPVLIVPPGALTHIEWYYGDTEAHQKFCQRLAERRTLVLYDRHGCGLSDRDRTDFTLEDDLADLEAVVKALGEPQVDLFGISFGGILAVAYAAKHPEAVRRMVLYGTGSGDSATGRNEWNTRRRSLVPLFQTDPELAWKTVAILFFPSGADPETFQSLARMLRDSTTLEMADRLARMRVDNQPLLSDVRIPTLVLHRRGDQSAPFVSGQELAKQLPDARFIPLDGDAHFPWVDDAESVLRPTIEFLTGKKLPEVTQAPTPWPSGTAVILFADIADSTALTERLGDAAFRAKARELDASLRAAIREHGGTPIEGKLLGDGVLAVFTSARQAIEAALACGAGGNEAGLPLHLGLHAGDVISEEGNVYGGAVNIASRVAGASEPGEVLVSDIVRGLARTSADVSFLDRGEHELKGVSDPVRLYEVRWRD